MNKRASGFLLHITSLPSKYGIGDLGPSAYEFADFLSKARQSYWQILPLNPTNTAYDNSPYFSMSAFAGNPLLISPELLAEDGLLNQSNLEHVPNLPENFVDYKAVTGYKEKLLNSAYKHFRKTKNNYEYEKFCDENSYWLDNFSLFVVLKSRYEGAVWSDWHEEVRDRKPDVIQSIKNDFKDEIDRIKFIQYIFFKQWYSLKNYCNNKGIRILGDLPIYVQYDSSDVWTNPETFKLDDKKKPYAVAGVPPDYFSETGQLWGNPLYNWDFLKNSRYVWWIQRLKHSFQLFDLVRIDHFRGLVAYWEVPAHEETAINGKWVEAPVRDFFDTVLEVFSHFPVVAEDLGHITPDVREIIHHYDFMTMKVLLFAFNNDISSNPYIPYNLVRNCVVYTGTHDNNTVKGWFKKEATPEIKDKLYKYFGRKLTPDTVHKEFIRLAMASVANLCIIPMQDSMGLGEQARMNVPSKKGGNWSWRLSDNFDWELTDQLAEMTEIYGRV